MLWLPHATQAHHPPCRLPCAISQDRGLGARTQGGCDQHELPWPGRVGKGGGVIQEEGVAWTGPGLWAQLWDSRLSPEPCPAQGPWGHLLPEHIVCVPCPRSFLGTGFCAAPWVPSRLPRFVPREPVFTRDLEPRAGASDQEARWDLDSGPGQPGA